MERAGGAGGGAKRVLIQEEGDEQLQQNGRQLRTWRSATQEVMSSDFYQSSHRAIRATFNVFDEVELN